MGFDGVLWRKRGGGSGADVWTGSGCRESLGIMVSDGRWGISGVWAFCGVWQGIRRGW